MTENMLLSCLTIQQLWRSNNILKGMWIEQNRDMGSPRDRLNNTLLTLHFSNANKTASTAAEINWILERTDELDQAIEVLILKWKKRSMLYWRGDFTILSTEMKKLWILSKLIKKKIKFLNQVITKATYRVRLEKIKVKN